jgi:outer membrane protein
MPEREEAELKLAAINAQYQETYKALDTEYTAKYEEYMKIEAELTENLKLRKQQEIIQLQERIQNFVPQAQQEIEQEQSKLMVPIQEKLINAIKAVGEEKGYSILNAQVFFHTGPNLIDATPLVKTKLGIK